MSTPEKALSDVAAAQIVRYRKRRDMTREQLAARCAELGYPALTGPALANIETGRRSADGRRRRDISIDELIAMAKALQVPPLLLLFPVGLVDTVDLLPGTPVDTWDAALWFTGEAYIGEDVASHWAVPLYLRRQHDRLLGAYIEALTDQRLFSPPADDPYNKRRRAKGEAALRRLRDVRAEMRRHGLTPPKLQDGDEAHIDLSHIDEHKHVFLTPEQADRFAADHPGALTFVDYNALRDPDSPYRPVKPGDGERIRQAQEIARNFEPSPPPDDDSDSAEPPTAR